MPGAVCILVTLLASAAGEREGAPLQPWGAAECAEGLRGVEGGAAQTCHACEVVVDEMQSRMAATWAPAMDSTKAKRAKTRAAMKELCGAEAFKGWAKLTNKEPGAGPTGEVTDDETVERLSTGSLAYTFVDFAKTMDRGGSIDGSLSMGPEVQKTLRRFATALLSTHGVLLAQEAAAPEVARVFDFDMRERLCVGMAQLCSTSVPEVPATKVAQTVRLNDDEEEEEEDGEEEEDEVITMNDEL